MELAGSTVVAAPADWTRYARTNYLYMRLACQIVKHKRTNNHHDHCHLLVCKTTGKSLAAVKAAGKKVGHSRKKAERELSC